MSKKLGRPKGSKSSYTKRTKSTKAMSYNEYVKRYEADELKGITMKTMLTKESYEQLYDFLRKEKSVYKYDRQRHIVLDRYGNKVKKDKNYERDFTGSVAQEIMRRSRKFSPEQAKVLAKMNKAFTGERTTHIQARGFSISEATNVFVWFTSLTPYEKNSIFGGGYI